MYSFYQCVKHHDTIQIREVSFTQILIELNLLSIQVMHEHSTSLIHHDHNCEIHFFSYYIYTLFPLKNCITLQLESYNLKSINDISLSLLLQVISIIMIPHSVC